MSLWRVIPTVGAPVSGRSAAASSAVVLPVALAATHAGVDAVSGSVAALVPAIGERFSLSGSGIAVLLAALSASSLLAQPLVGRLADSFGARRVAVAGGLLAATLLSLLGVVGELWLLYAATVAGGLGSAAFHPAAAALARQSTAARPSMGVGLFSAGGLLGLAIGPVALVTLVSFGGLGVTPLLMIPGVALSLLLWRLLPSVPAPSAPPRVSGGSLALVRGPVGRIALAAMLVGVSVTTFHVGVPLWMTQHGGVRTDSASIGWALGAFDLAAAAGGLAAALVSTRIAPARVATAGLLVAPGAFAATLLTEAGSAGFFAACLVAGAALNTAWPLLFVAAQDRSDGAVAAASGVMGFAAGIGGVAFIGIGALSDAAGLAVGLAVGFAAVVPAAGMTSRWLDRYPTRAAVLDVIAAVACPCHACSCPPSRSRYDDCAVVTA